MPERKTGSAQKREERKSEDEGKYRNKEQEEDYERYYKQDFGPIHPGHLLLGYLFRE
jgi:hypothetical protein